MNGQLRLHFLGTGTIFPDPDRSCSATLLETPKGNLLVDIGSGALRRMAVDGFDIFDINYIFLTHFHPDHVGDLIPLLFAIRNMRKANDDRVLRIWGPVGLYRFVQGMERAYGKWVQYSSRDVKFYELKRRLVDFPGFRVIWNKVVHNQESVGYRFEIGNKIIAFSGDSGYCQDLIRLCKDADIAVIECAHADEFAVKGHLSPSLAAKIAENAAAKKMVMVHFYPDVLKGDPLKVAQKYYSGEIVMPNDGESISISLSEN